MKRISAVIRSSLSWAWAHKLRVAVLVLILALAAPRPAESQFLSPCCAILSAGLTTISNTLKSVVGGALSNIRSIEQDIRNFEQTVVWPQNLISQAQALVGKTQGIYNQIRGITQIPVNSATLPAAQQLEQILLSRDPNQVAQTTAQYTTVYGPVPNATAAPPDVRNVIDMADAAAQAAMKRAIEIDALADLQLQAADHHGDDPRQQQNDVGEYRDQADEGQKSCQVSLPLKDGDDVGRGQAS